MKAWGFLPGGTSAQHLSLLCRVGWDSFGRSVLPRGAQEHLKQSKGKAVLCFVPGTCQQVPTSAAALRRVSPTRSLASDRQGPGVAQCPGGCAVASQAST